MNQFIHYFILFIIVICILISYNSLHSELVSVNSTVDNQKYSVRNLPDKQKAADLLARIRKKINLIVTTLNEKFPNDTRVKRLTKNLKNIKISELISTSNFTSYSLNKGEKIVFCIRNKKTQKLININTLMFVAIHELAHVMTIDIGHTPKFWANMKFILQVAIDANIYKKQDFEKKPEPYCGIMITSSPLDD